MNNKEKYFLYKKATNWGTDAQGKPLSYTAMRNTLPHMNDASFKNWARTKGYSPSGPAQGAAAGVPATPAAPSPMNNDPFANGVSPTTYTPQQLVERGGLPGTPVPVDSNSTKPQTRPGVQNRNNNPTAQQQWNRMGGDPNTRNIAYSPGRN